MSSPTETDYDPASGTGRGLIDFLDMVQKQGDMKPATASALRTGCKKVIDSDVLLDADMRNIEVDDVVRQFRNKIWGKAKDNTVDEYEQRFRQSVEMYRKWLNQDKDWLPSRTRASATRSRPSSSNAVKVSEAGQSAASALAGQSAAVVQTGMVTYPLPIRPGVKATLILPEDLTAREAQRISQVVAALAFEERRELMPAPPKPAGTDR